MGIVYTWNKGTERESGRKSAAVGQKQRGTTMERPGAVRHVYAERTALTELMDLT